MEGYRFDQLVRNLSSSRRRALAGLTGGLLATLPLLAGGPAAARHKHKHKHKHQPPCTPQCLNKTCGPDECGSTCGTCAAANCTGTTLTTETCESGVCTPHQTSCGQNQICNNNACCTRATEPSCHKTPADDGCGHPYPSNCAHVCCNTAGGRICCTHNCCETNTIGVFVCQQDTCR